MRALRELSPRRRQWIRFLRQLPLDPASLPDPLPEPRPDDFIICGCPRSGTTLVAAALFQPPRVVTVMEPWDGMRLAPAALFASLRHEIESTGHLTRGRLDVRALRRDGTVAWTREGKAPVAVEVAEGWQLGVKWPGYWRYLDRLPTTRFVVCIRHPADVVASLKSLRGPGRDGLQFDTRFNRHLNDTLAAATDDPAERRVLLYDHVYAHLLPHLGRAHVHVVRYEDWAISPSAVLDGLSQFLGTDVRRAPVAVRPGSGRHLLDARDRSLLATCCGTAEALGYDL